MLPGCPDRLRERAAGLRQRPAACTRPGCSTRRAPPSCVREDIGRHNAVDKVVGARILAGEPPPPPVLCVSGRIGFEIVQKAVVAGVGVLAAVGAPSSASRCALAERGRAVHWRASVGTSGSSSTPGARPPRRVRAVLSAPPPTVVACASSTPPTGTWAGPSTASGMLGAQAAYVDHLLDDGRGRAGRPRGGRRRRLRPGAAAGRRRRAGRRRLRPARRLAGAGGGHQRQPRLRPAARLRRPAHRRRRRAPAHPLAGRRHARCCSTTTHGPVAVYGIPYLEPDARRGEPWELPARSHEAALGRGDAPGPRRPATARPAPARWCWRTRSSPAPDAAASDDASATSASAASQIVPTRLFDRRRLRRARPPARAARPSTETVRYSGSPLAYSFSEADHGKGSWLVDLGADGRRAPSSSRPRCRAGWPGCAATSTTCCRRRRSPRTRTPGCRSTLTDRGARPQAMERLRERFPHALVLGFEPDGRARRRGPVLPRVAGRSDLDIALGFVAEVRGLAATTEERAAAPAGLRRLPATGPRRRLPARARGAADAAAPPDVTAFGPFAGTVDRRLRRARTRPGCSC